MHARVCLTFVVHMCPRGSQVRKLFPLLLLRLLHGSAAVHARTVAASPQQQQQQPGDVGEDAAADVGAAGLRTHFQRRPLMLHKKKRKPEKRQRAACLSSSLANWRIARRRLCR